MAFIPVIDGDLIPAHPMTAIAAGAGAEVPLITGTNSEECRLFLVPSGMAALITDDLLAGLLAALGISPQVAGLYRSNRPGATPGDILAALLTDKFFRLPAFAVAEARIGAPAPTYVYEFAWQSPVGGLGACHSLEIPFVFDTLSASGAELVIGPDRPQHLADQMHQAWIGFARSGDPGWRAFDKDYPVRVFPAPTQPSSWTRARMSAGSGRTPRLRARISAGQRTQARRHLPSDHAEPIRVAQADPKRGIPCRHITPKAPTGSASPGLPGVHPAADCSDKSYKLQSSKD